jgi:hypothetical protein
LLSEEINTNFSNDVYEDIGFLGLLEFLGTQYQYSVSSIPRVEADKNTSTVIPANRKRRRKGNPVVSDETVMYGYRFSATLTTDRLHYKLQTRPLVREGAPRRRAKKFSGKSKVKSKIWSWALKGCPIPRYTD